MIAQLVKMQIRDLNSDLLSSKECVLSAVPPISSHSYESSSCKIFRLHTSLGPHTIAIVREDTCAHLRDEKTEAQEFEKKSRVTSRTSHLPNITRSTVVLSV